MRERKEPSRQEEVVGNPTFREGPPPERPSRERVEAWIDGKLSDEEAAYVRWLVTCYREWNQMEQEVLLERVKAMSAQERICVIEAIINSNREDS